jgi:hypothetical protein
MRISHQLLRIAEARVRLILDELNDCHPDDSGRRNRLAESLQEAERSLRHQRKMVAAESSR